MNKLELANKVLEKCRLDSIKSFSDSLLSQFPYNNILCFMDEAIHFFSNAQVLSWAFTSSGLTYVENLSEYDLKDYDIDPNLITLVYTPGSVEGTKDIIPVVSNTDFESYSANPAVRSKPSCCTKYDNIIKFYPELNQDFSIMIDHFRQMSPLLKTSEEIDIVPKQYQVAIEDYICSCMSAVLFKKSSLNFEDSFDRGFARLTKASQVADGQTELPSNIDWGGMLL